MATGNSRRNRLAFRPCIVRQAHRSVSEKAAIEPASSQISQFIRTNFPIAPVPSVPEIVLHRAGPKSGLSGRGETDKDFVTPYWAFAWGGGLALARYTLDHSEIVAGRAVLDLGAGSGIVGIAAARAGAKRVVAADVDRYAIAAIGLNAAANRVLISTFLGDPTTGAPPDVDVVLVGDLFYAEDLALRVTSFLERCVGSNIDVVIGDPWRAFLPQGRLQLLAAYPGADFANDDRGGSKQNAVFSFKR